MSTTAMFQCLNCRLARRAEVVGTRSRRPTPHHSEANSSVAKLLALKRCPRCGYFDRGVASHNRRTLRFVQTTLAIAFALAALAVLVIGSRVVFAIGGVVLVGGYLLALRRLAVRYPHDVERRVRLVEAVPRSDGWWQ